MPMGEDQAGAMSMRSMVTYQIHVTGEVRAPGTYRVPPSTRLAEVIMRAKGPLENGSIRKVQILRNGKIVKRCDLWTYQKAGSLAENPYMMDNDVVHVPLRERMVEVVGAVSRPSKYELLNESTLQQVLDLAGGTTSAMSTASAIKVVRFVDDKKQILQIENKKDSIAQFQIRDDDVIVVPTVLMAQKRFDYDILELPSTRNFLPSMENRVFVVGGVRQPGAYDYNPYYSVSQYLALAGGKTRLAKDKIEIDTSAGERKVVDASYTQLSPGDSIFIPEKRISDEFWVAWIATLASIGLSAVAIFKR